jgi:type VI protein secretion system component VasF
MRRRQSRQQAVAEEADERLVLAVKFAMVMVACLTALEITYLTVLHAWSSEIFAAITGLSGSIVGIFLGKKAG